MFKDIALKTATILFVTLALFGISYPDLAHADPADCTRSDINAGLVRGAETGKSDADGAAKLLINKLGTQQTFAMLGWQVNPDYKPADHCFEYWQGTKALPASAVRHCEQHAQDLSRLYASYSVDAPPIVFKSEYYWAQKREFDRAWPELVKAWKADGGSQDDTSYLKHPGCAKPLQQGWTGSEYFYDGREHPICRAHKIEQLENN